ncbi:MAG: ATP-binding cassette domain-containing protein [Clostridiales bacterium]|jgi:ABC-2 type transport system ATP-binding protein|nr:ATP-binding cassette domain-containing protein [Clostridiales bacterium]
MGLLVKNVSKSFGDKKAVDNLSFSMDQPGVFGLIGTNGAGKTTTIRMILGVMDRDEGEITWNGGPIRRDTVRFGYMPEERGIYPKVKVSEQLIYFGVLRGMSRKDAAASADRWLERLGVTEYKQMLAEKLSKGNQQKIQLIATIIHDPELIFLDEPFSGLDPINAEVFKSVIGELIADNKTIIMSSHQMATVEEYCRDLLILKRGRTVLQGNLHDIKAGYGHTNLSVSCRQDVTAEAERFGLRLIEKTAGGCEFKMNGDESAHGFLKALVDQGIYPERFEIREPSLHEIFVEKVGEAE